MPAGARLLGGYWSACSAVIPPAFAWASSSVMMGFGVLVGFMVVFLVPFVLCGSDRDVKWAFLVNKHAVYAKSAMF